MSYKLFVAASLVLLLATFISIFHPPRHESERQIQGPQVIPIPGAFGPESFAFDRDGGGPYTGVSDGRIIKWLGNESWWVDFAVTSPNRWVLGGLVDGDSGKKERSGCEGSVEMEYKCGRPLGLCFDKENGNLYIADAYMGLLVVSPQGGFARPVAKQAQSIFLKFTNGVNIDQSSGVVYFTDSSKILQRREYISAILKGDSTGRLLKLDPKTNQVTVLLDNLTFPNGVALSQKGDFLLVAESTSCRILRQWIEPSSPKAGQVEVFAQLPGFPDNIKRNKHGEFWVAVNSKRGKVFDWILSNVWLANFLARIPIDLTRAHLYLANFAGHGLAIKLSENGDVLQMLEDKKGKTWKYCSEVAEDEDGFLWIGSVKFPYAVKLFTNQTLAKVK